MSRLTGRSGGGGLAARRAHAFSPTYRLFYDRPVEVARAEGVWITERDGTRLLDAYNNVPVIGHSNPDVRAAVETQLARINTHTRYLDAFVVDYAERLLAQLPTALDRLIFVCSGSEANDIALQIARAATGAHGVIVTANAYHGITSSIADISPSLVGSSVPDHVATVRLPDDGLDSVAAAAAFAVEIVAAIDRLVDPGHGVAAIVVDSALTSDGIVDGRPHWLGAGIELVQRAGGLHIADEVQAGFCRLGSWWGFEGFGGRPDLVTLGKPMGNGLPIAAVVGTESLFAEAGHRRFATFGGTPATVAAAGVVLDELVRLDAANRADRLGARLRERFEDAVASTSIPALVRGAGLLTGVELLGDDSGRRAGRLADLMRDEGVLVGTTGAAGQVLKVRPPLIIEDEHLELVAAGLLRALEALERGE